VTTPSPLTTTLFPSCSMDISFKDDVNVTLLLVFPSWLLPFIGWGLRYFNEGELSFDATFYFSLRTAHYSILKTLTLHGSCFYWRNPPPPPPQSDTLLLNVFFYKMTKSLIRYTFKIQKQERSGTLFKEVGCSEHCFIPEKRNDTGHSSNVTYMKPIYIRDI
jgi:hypothetical protein